MRISKKRSSSSSEN